MTYPIPEGTNNQELVLFPPSVPSFNEDYQAIEDYNERETLYRFNSIVKTPGIVSKKATELLVDQTQRMLCPIATGVGNGIIITAGTGFTNNGARITVPLPLTVTDITTCVGYTDPASATGNVYIVLRKIEEDGYPRTHTMDGTQHNTRRRIKYDNSIVEFIEYDPAESELTDKDVIILGQLTSTSPITFDLTEATGLRKLLRITEGLTCETTGFTMEGDIDMNYIYNILNVPEWGSTYWKANGVPHNSDFVRLFGRVNSTIFTISGLKFMAVSGNYGLQVLNDGVKISILGGQIPVRQINISATELPFKTIPANYVMYYSGTDYEFGLTDTASGGIEFANLPVEPITSFNFGTTGDIRKIPICFHYYLNGVRRLIFANGITLSENEEIRTDGKLSTYVERNGDTMYGDLRIIQDNARVWFRRSTNDSDSDFNPGLIWEDSLGGQTSMFYRKDIEDGVPANYGDHILTVYNPNTTTYKHFTFKNDGRLQITGDPTSANDVIRFEFATGNNGFVRKTGDTMTGKLIVNGDFDIGTWVGTGAKKYGYCYGDFLVTADNLNRGGKIQNSGSAYIGKNLEVGRGEGGTYDGTDGNALIFGNLEVGQSTDNPPHSAKVHGYVDLRHTLNAPDPPTDGGSYYIFPRAIAGGYTDLQGVSPTGVYDRLINKVGISPDMSADLTDPQTSTSTGLTVDMTYIFGTKFLAVVNLNCSQSAGTSRTLIINIKDADGTVVFTHSRFITTGSGTQDINFSAILGAPVSNTKSYTVYAYFNGVSSATINKANSSFSVTALY